MGVTVSNQTFVFLGSIGVGALLGLFYDCFRISRVAFPLPAGIILLEDLVFCSACAIATFAYMLTTVEGQVRFFVLVGELLGGVVYYVTVGNLVMSLAQTITAFLRRFFRILYRIFGRPIVVLTRRIFRLAGKIWGSGNAYLKKQGGRAKFRLKERRILLYNLVKGSAQSKARPKWLRRWKGLHEK